MDEWILMMRSRGWLCRSVSAAVVGADVLLADATYSRLHARPLLSTSANGGRPLCAPRCSRQHRHQRRRADSLPAAHGLRREDSARPLPPAVWGNQHGCFTAAVFVCWWHYEEVVCEQQQPHGTFAAAAAGLAFSALTLLAGHREEHPACSNWLMRCCCGCLSGVRCRLHMVQLMPLLSQNPVISSLI